ncbi:MAG: hypothetical protein U5K43_06505 [Halofilum sp. (in: g-proteobacteria)]|nr:hypothetical protein [Halofilum sp. (in: g-proteobacteria)]
MGSFAAVIGRCWSAGSGWLAGDPRAGLSLLALFGGGALLLARARPP